MENILFKLHDCLAFVHSFMFSMNFVYLRIFTMKYFLDLDSEKVNMTRSGMLSVEDLPSAVPSDAARYHVFRFKHSHEGDYLESNGETLSE